MKNKMLRSLLAIGMIATAPIFTGCSKDNRDDPTPDPDPTPIGEVVLNTEAAQHGYMVLKTENKEGEKWGFFVGVANADLDNAWIDLNYNGVKDTGEAIKDFSFFFNTRVVASQITSQTIVVYGKVNSLTCTNLASLDVSKNTALTNLACSKSKLTALDVSKNGELRHLSCYTNKISTAEMNKLVVNLPYRSSLSTLDKGFFFGWDYNSATPEGNGKPYGLKVIFKEKNWYVYERKEGASNWTEWE